MRPRLIVLALAATTATAAHAGSQSSNTSSNSSSNNGRVHERIVGTYCADGYCERYVERRVYRTDRRDRRDRSGWRRGSDASYSYRPRRDDDDD